jgi:hypothetical protein
MTAILEILLITFLIMFFVRIFSAFYIVRRHANSARKKSEENVNSRKVSKDTGEYVDFEEVKKK